MQSSEADQGICVRGVPSPLPCRPLLLEVGSPFKPQGVCGSAVSSRSGVQGGAPAENESGAL